MNSMTGFGRAELARNGDRAAVELRAVNGKQLDIRFSLPPDFSGIEPDLRRLFHGRVSRGSLTVSVTFQPSPHRAAARMRIDEELAERAAERLRALARRLGLAPDLSLAQILALPGIVTLDESGGADEEAESLVREAVSAALDALRAMQEREGETLKRQLEQETAALREAAANIRDRADRVLRSWRDRLRAQIAQLGVELSLDDERLARELAFHAERSDVSEELTRILSHVGEFERLLRTDGPVGRTLMFLCQELNREINTLAAKTRDTESSGDVLTLKTVLGKIKEQCANIE